MLLSPGSALWPVLRFAVVLDTTTRQGWKKRRFLEFFFRFLGFLRFFRFLGFNVHNAVMTHDK